MLGRTGDGISVAIKVTAANSTAEHELELKCYEKLNATVDRKSEKYGVPFIYHSGEFLDFKTMIMTKLDRTLDSLEYKFGVLSRDSILIMFRDLVKFDFLN